MTGTEQSTSAPAVSGMGRARAANGLAARYLLRSTRGNLKTGREKRGSRMRTIICGVDRSPGARVALRVAAGLATELDARLVAVHVLDRVADIEASAERTAANLLYDEIPDIAAEARGEVGDVAERLATVARDEDAMMIMLGARSRGRSRSFLRARCAGELGELTSAPVLVAPSQLAAMPTTPNTATIRGGPR
jgi:nucleotide-binding universal stress UspA family protein